MLTEKELLEATAAYFAQNLLRTGIPAKFYKLPPEILAEYEDQKRRDQEIVKEEIRQKAAEIQEYPGRICPRYRRRSVGYFFPGEWE